MTSAQQPDIASDTPWWHTRPAPASDAHAATPAAAQTSQLTEQSEPAEPEPPIILFDADEAPTPNAENADAGANSDDAESLRKSWYTPFHDDGVQFSFDILQRGYNPYDRGRPASDTLPWRGHRRG